MLKIYILFFILTVILGVYERDLTFSAAMLIFGIAALLERTAKQHKKKIRKGAKKCTEAELKKRCA